MIKFTVTYDITTVQSAEEGDCEEMGFVTAGGELVPLEGGGVAADHAMRLREALHLVDPRENSGRWFTEVDGREDYRTGAVERRSLHPPRGATPSSYGRLVRLLGAR